MQSRGMSAVEAVSNVILGWLVAFLTQLVLFPVVGLQATLAQNIVISCAFTSISLVRSYALRRVFVRLNGAQADAGLGGREAR